MEEATILTAEQAIQRSPHCYCYLLQTEVPRSQRTYIGFTVDPPRRIRQHNGEITAGAWKTSKGRPWKMRCFVTGFPNKTVALQFEWQWQHPLESRVARDALRDLSLPRTRNLTHQLMVLRALLTCSLWTQLDLRIVPLDLDISRHFHAAGILAQNLAEPSDLNSVANILRRSVIRAQAVTYPSTCSVCNGSDVTTQHRLQLWTCDVCTTSAHLTCLAKREKKILPVYASCVTCMTRYPWRSIVAQVMASNGIPQQEDEDENDDEPLELGDNDDDNNDEISSGNDSSAAGEVIEVEVLLDLTQT